MSTFTVQCWGCNYSETHPWNGPGPEYDAAIKDLESRGWQRRAFWPPNWDKGPWFCSRECAYGSFNAVQAQDYWDQKEFEGYCKEATVPPVFWMPLAFAGILLVAMLLGDCLHHVGIQ